MHGVPISHLSNTLIGSEKVVVPIALIGREYKLVILCLLIDISTEEKTRIGETHETFNIMTGGGH